MSNSWVKTRGANDIHCESILANKTFRAHLEWWKGICSMLSLLERSVTNWQRHGGTRMGAALAFYTAISLAPLATLTFSALSYAVHREMARGQIVETFHLLIGTSGAKLLDSILTHATPGRTSMLQTVISSLILLFSAAQVFGELQNSLDVIWDLSGEKRPLSSFFRNRLWSMAMVLICGLTLLVSLFVSALTNWTTHVITAYGVPINFVHGAFLFVASTVIFGCLFKFLPRVSLAFADVWLGATLTACLVVAGRWVLGLYLQRTNLSATYGTLSSFLIVLIWVYFLAQLFYFGAEFTRCYTERFGTHSRSVR